MKKAFMKKMCVYRGSHGKGRSSGEVQTGRCAEAPGEVQQRTRQAKTGYRLQDAILQKQVYTFRARSASGLGCVQAETRQGGRHNNEDSESAASQMKGAAIISHLTH